MLTEALLGDRREAEIAARLPVGFGGLFGGVMPATVKDLEDPEGQGRIKIALAAVPDPANAECELWARMATLFAGNNRGSWFLPEVGDEVLVAFEQGDPRRPYVLGGLWNGVDSPPVSGSNGNNVKKIVSRNGVVITIDDSQGQETLKLETPAGQTITLKDGPGAVTIEDSNGNSVKLEASGISIDAAARLSISCSQMSVSASMVSVDAGMSNFSGVVRADTVICNSIVAASYTPAREHLVTALSHPVLWAGPRPLWSSTQGLGGAPAILRFATDEFMDELNGLLDTDPGLLATKVARYESWRDPQGAHEPTDLVQRVPLPAPIRDARRRTLFGKHQGLPVAANPPQRRLKLYQPVHQRHYVVCGTLACRNPGFPDRKPAGPHEQVGYVLRRLLPDRDGNLVEHGFVKQRDGAIWQRLAGDDPTLLAPGEERIKLFPLRHRDGAELRRTLWGGVIPVGKREEYLAAAVSKTAPSLLEGQVAAMTPAAPATRPNSVQARLAEFKQDFSETWKALIQAALKAASDINADTDDANTPASRQKQVRERNLAFQSQSWLLLSDLMAFLDRHLKPVAAAIRAGQPGTLTGKKLDLYTWFTHELSAAQAGALASGFAPADPNQPTHLSSFQKALKKIGVPATAQLLEDVETAYRAAAADRALWPDFHFQLAGIANDGNGGAASADGAFTLLPTAVPVPAGEPELVAATMTTAQPSGPAADTTGQAQGWFARVDTLVAMVGRALDGTDEAEARALPFALKLSQTMVQTAGDAGRFVIRFVHLNEDCGPMDPPTLSAPSEEFELASFFDPDAPARPIRITLPADTSPAGLRKHAKGTAFVMSNMLCGQVQRAKGLGFIDLVRQVLPWPLHKDIEIGDGGGCKNAGGLDIGMICSISIPIITLCALILLMIIISLLDFVFRWLPWFILCFPVPGLKGKKPAGAT